MKWRDISTAPKDNSAKVNYIIITDGICLPDLVIWCNERPARKDRYGTFWHARPAGWFNVASSRSRIQNPTHWMPVPDQPTHVRRKAREKVK